MGYWFGGVAVVALLAVVAVAAGSEMPAFQAYATTYSSRQFVQLHVESAFLRVLVAVASWKKRMQK